MSKLIWNKLPLTEADVSLSKVLRCGQAFRWKNIDGIWSCSLAGRIVFLKQDQSYLYYSSLYNKHLQDEKSKIKDDTIDIITDYFNLSVNLPSLYNQWRKADSNFDKIADKFIGIRILRQDPWENLVSFICSTNNNVKRISQMCENLCVHFGEYIGEHEGVQYYDFPSAAALADGSEEKLRSLGFGYRAKYIHKTALMINEDKHGLEKLSLLREKSYDEAHQELLKYTGVGPKVADCVCLMSLDKHDVIPVDTHVYQIAKKNYKFSAKGDTVTKAVYGAISTFFKDIFGPYAGWAQSVLFANDLSDLNNGVNTITKVVKAEVKAKNIVKDIIVLAPSSAVKLETNLENPTIKKLLEGTSIKVEEVEYSNNGRPIRSKRQKLK